MLTSSVAETLVNVDTVIIDEIHAMATTKRGAHLMLSLERLEAITARPPQRIGLSATQRPLEEVAHFLGGHGADGARRRVNIVDAGMRKQMEVDVVVGGDGEHLGERVPGLARCWPIARRSSSATHVAKPGGGEPQRAGRRRTGQGAPRLAGLASSAS